MIPVTIKYISPDDPAYRGVWDLREEVLRKPLGLSLRDEDLSGEAGEQIIAALQGDAVVGCVMLRPAGTEALKLRQMAVAVSQQGRGTGAALVHAAETFALRNGYKAITLHARMTAVPFYERLGYRAEGDVFEEVGIPHLLMNKQLL